MRFRLKADTKGCEIERNARGIASLDSENDAFLTASSGHTLTNKKLSYDQLTGIPIRAPANWNETDETHISFIQNKPTVPENTDTQADWTETDASSAAHIFNKPALSTNSTLALSGGTLTLTDSAGDTVTADISSINTDNARTQ